MKKVLLATSALVATAGFAAADVAVSGSAQMGVEYNEANVGDSTVYNAEVGINFAASGETDGGLTFGFDTNYRINNGADPVNDDTTVYIGGAFGKLSMGAVTEADRLIGLDDLGLDGLGTDDVAEDLSGDDIVSGMTGANTNYTYSGGALTFAVSGDLGDVNGNGSDAYAVGAKYDAGSFAIALGYGDAGDAAGTNATTVGVSAGLGGVDFAAIYTDNNNRGKAYGATASFTTGATTITAAYSDSDEATDAAYGLGLAYDLGGGATLKGGVASVGGNNVADFGVAMSF